MEKNKYYVIRERTGDGHKLVDIGIPIEFEVWLDNYFDSSTKENLPEEQKTPEEWKDFVYYQSALDFGYGLLSKEGIEIDKVTKEDALKILRAAHRDLEKELKSLVDNMDGFSNGIISLEQLSSNS